MRGGADKPERRLSRALALTWAGLICERLVRAFWPVAALAGAVLALLALGVQDRVPVIALWWSGAIVAALAVALALWGGWRLRWPGREAARARLDATMPGRPLQALDDAQAVGTGDSASAALWRAHVARMARVAARARPVAPDLRLNARDPYALRYAAALLVMVALVFGSAGRVASVRDLAPGSGAAMAAGPAWEGWVEPPAYTGLPTLCLPDQPEGPLRVAQGASVTIRVYGDADRYSITGDVSDPGAQAGDDADTDAGGTKTAATGTDGTHRFTVTRSGRLAVEGPGGRAWDVRMRSDGAPRVAVSGDPKTSAEGRMGLPFEASDDHGVVAGQARITLDMAAVDRRHGLAVDPEPRAPVTLDLPMPITGDSAEFEETLVEDFSRHPWAHLPVKVALSVRDARDQQGLAEPVTMSLPGRRFFDPLAAAVIEQRRDLLWSRENAPRAARLLRALSHRPEEGLFRSETDYLRLRVILRRLENMTAHGLTGPQRDDIAAALWDLAVSLEEGDIDDARERLKRAQERLSEAMRRGASDEEIARLMQELREATRDYTRQLAQEAQRDGERSAQQQADPGNTMQMTQNDLQQMMDRIQELMEQGRMAEAQQALSELQQLMENMRVTQGQGGQSPGEQAMDGLADTLRDQQGLSDQAFRELQEQFNPDADAGRSQGNEGRSGGEGRGQSHEGTGGDGAGEQQGAQPGGQQQGDGALADRQRALREELDRQRGNLPGAGTPEGEAARDALDRAGRAMDEAEDALRGDDLAGAIDRQSQAMDALRDGMRNLGDAMAQRRSRQGRGDAQQRGDAGGQRQDPLGRDPGASGPAGTRDSMLRGEDVERRAQDLLEELRRRSGEGGRDRKELDYLRRLLERF